MNMYILQAEIDAAVGFTNVIKKISQSVSSDGLFYHGCFKLIYESLRNSSDSSRKQILRDILGKFSCCVLKMCVVLSH